MPRLAISETLRGQDLEGGRLVEPRRGCSAGSLRRGGPYESVSNVDLANGAGVFDSPPRWASARGLDYKFLHDGIEIDTI